MNLPFQRAALGAGAAFVTIEDALVQRPDVSASNGVVHVIGKVLMPPRP